jgi:hypothetical protein
MNARGYAAIAALSLAPLLGCESGVPGELCGRTQPCGGDVVGSWTVTHSCLSSGAAVARVESAIGVSCKALTLDSVRANQEGTITFAADLTFTGNVSAGGTVTVRLPPSCLGGLTCTQVDDALMTAGLSEDACMGTSSCICPIARQPLTIAGAGTYLAEGTTLTFRSPSDTVITRQYCVTDSSMHLVVTSSGGDIIDDVMLERVTR